MKVIYFNKVLEDVCKEIKIVLHSVNLLKGEVLNLINKEIVVYKKMEIQIILGILIL